MFTSKYGSNLIKIYFEYTSIFTFETLTRRIGVTSLSGPCPPPSLGQKWLCIMGEPLF